MIKDGQKLVLPILDAFDREIPVTFANAHPGTSQILKISVKLDLGHSRHR